MSASFADTVRAARQEKRVRLHEVASRLNLSVPYISDMELGNRRPPEPPRVKAWAELLGLDPTPLVTLAQRERAGGECGHSVQLEAADRLLKASDRFTNCVNEFGFDTPFSCGEYFEALIDAEDAYREAQP